MCDSVYLKTETSLNILGHRSVMEWGIIEAGGFQNVA